MALISLTPPTWQSGDLLSAARINHLATCINAIKGGAYAPTAFFVRSGNDAVWHCRRRRWRYLHVSFTTAATGGGGSCTTRIQINGVTVYNSGVLYPTGTTQVFDLDATAVGVGDAYSVAVSYTASDATHETTGIVETSSATKTGIGSYSQPASFTGVETPAQFLSNLQSLSSAVASLAEVVITPSSPWLRVTEPWTFEARRKFRYLVVGVDISGDSPDVDVYVNNTTVVNAASSSFEAVIDLNGVSGGPAVRDFYRLEVRRNAGVSTLNYAYETETAITTSAPMWNHGAAVDGTASLWQNYANVLNAAHAILGAAGWQTPCIWRPYNNPRWGLRKTKRFLHYMRNGSLPATLQDPAGRHDDVGLSRTTDDEPWASYDLDTIDWLSPGGLLYVYQADCVWLDDEP